jgi:hypothetical protein
MATGGTGNATVTLGGSGGTTITPPDPTGGAAGCENLQCRQQVCPDGEETTVTGTVYAPNGTLPIYNALVYVPNAPVPAFPSRVACDRCGALPPGRPVVSAVTDANGAFHLKERYRSATTSRSSSRSAMAASVRRSERPGLQRDGRDRSRKNAPAAKPYGRRHAAHRRHDRFLRQSRLPHLEARHRSRRVGRRGDDKAVTFYAGKALDFDPHKDDRFTGSLADMTSATELWQNFETLSSYDVAILSCECEEALENKGAPAYDAITRYLAAGGRVFGTDYQYVWYQHSTDPNWVSAATVPGAAPDGFPTGASPIHLDTSFPKARRSPIGSASSRPKMNTPKS